MAGPPRHPLPAGPRLPGCRALFGRTRGRTGQKGDLDLALIPPPVPEARRLVLAMAETKGRRRFLLGESLCGGGLTSRWPLAAARQSRRRGATPGDRSTRRRLSKLRRSRPKRRGSPTSNGHWCVPCCPHKGAVQAGLPTTIAECSAASCGWRGQDRRGGRCLRSTASGRAHTGATSCGPSKAYVSASSEC
jgi:hypothetical protein